MASSSGRSRARRVESYEEWHTRLSSVNTPADPSSAEVALQFLQAGHDLTEPVLTQHLKRIQKEELSKLQRFKLRIAGGFNLPGSIAVMVPSILPSFRHLSIISDTMFCSYFHFSDSHTSGAPDPTGTLAPGEVYVALPISKDRARTYATAPPHMSQTAGSVVTGQVVVIRTPTLHQDEIRVMQAVHNDHLAQFLKGTAGGVLFFSTQGHRSAADEMVGYCAFI
jgi:hypothetical protein